MTSINVSYYKQDLPDNDSYYNKECFVKHGEGIENTTSFVYTGFLSDVGLYFTGFMAISGVFLNSLTIITLLYNRSTREERFTPIIISLATCNLLFSFLVLPINASRFYYR